MIQTLIRRLDFDQLINLLPEWQRPYFLSDTIEVNNETLKDYILDSINELIVENTFITNIIDYLSKNEYQELIDSIEDLSQFIFNPRKLKQQIILKKISIKTLNRIRHYFGVVVDESNVIFADLEEISPLSQRFFELLDYQMFIKEKMMSILISNYLLPRVLIHMPTGTGKTKTTMHTVIQYLIDILKNRGLIIWVAHTNILLEQGIDTFINVWSHLGNKSVNIQRLFGGNTINLSTEKLNGVIFCNISSLINIRKKDIAMFEILAKNINLIVFDEAHKILASETKQTINSLMVKKDGYENKTLVGLTATPGRNIYNDDDNSHLAEFFERRIISIDIDVIDKFSKSEIDYANQGERDSKIIKYFQERKILSKLKREVIDYNFSEKFYEDLDIKLKRSKSEDYANEVLHLYSMNLERNLVIISRLKKLSVDNTPTIFFACSVEHGKLISSILKSQGLKISQVYADTNRIVREKEISNFKNGFSKILINVSVLTTGFDSTNIRCVFIARPTKSIVLYSQMIGRGLRGPKMGGNEECLLIDMKDNLERFADENEAFSYFEEYWR